MVGKIGKLGARITLDCHLFPRGGAALSNYRWQMTHKLPKLGPKGGQRLPDRKSYFILNRHAHMAAVLNVSRSFPWPTN